jgi:TatD DNase family protein
MLFDSHAHLNFKAFKDDYRQVIKRCQENNVWMINVGSQYETSKKAIEIAEKYDKGVYAAVGLHPIHVEDENFDYEKYSDLAKNPKVVAIGETGLDYYRDKNNPSTSFRASQKEIFLKHLELARELNKPVIIHCREAHRDLTEILKIETQKLKANSRGVIHCFTGNQKQAEKYLELGFYLGFTGIITYSSDYDEIIKNLPLDKILIETDSPYLTPIPFRDQRNEPSYVKYVAEKIATLKNLPLEKIAEQTTNNALKLFSIML